jgi:hypothetical protein
VLKYDWFKETVEVFRRNMMLIILKNVKKSHYRPGQTLRVIGG